MTTPSRAPSESQILREIRLAVGQLPGVVVWRNNVGIARYTARGGKGAAVPFGLVVGAPDLVGVMSIGGTPGIVSGVPLPHPSPTPVGVALFIEAKSAHGHLSIEQALFRDLVVRLGAVHLVARSAQEALDGIADARTRLSSRLA